MKKLTLIIGFLLLLSSCSKEEDVCYSCDSEIDAWVKSNKTELAEMTREEYSKLDIIKQKAAYVSFSPKRRKQFWDEKMNEILIEIPFTKGEKEYLKYIQKTIKNHKFGKVFSIEKNMEIMKWMEEGKNKFGWSNEFLYNAFFKVSMLKQQNSLSLTDASSSCNCIYDIFCWINNSGSCDPQDKCDSSSSGGCGALIELNCTGKCN